MADLTTIEQRIDDLYTEVSNDEQLLEAHETAANVDIDFINQELLILDQQTMRIHDELHETAIDVDNNTSSINRINNKNYQVQIDALNNAYLGLQTDLNHYLNTFQNDSNKINGKLNRQAQEIRQLETAISGEAEHVIISMTEFQRITPDNDKIYLVYL